jgi:hypothetical protein
MRARVRKTQAFTLTHQIAVGDEVEIESAIGIALVTAHSAVGLLDTEE